jgi:glucose-6-phosphate isomerase
MASHFSEDKNRRKAHFFEDKNTTTLHFSEDRHKVLELFETSKQLVKRGMKNTEKGANKK